MPEPGDLHRVHLGECFRGAAYRHAIGESEPFWTRGMFDRLPTSVLVTCIEYCHESSGFDCSADEGFRIKLPSTAMADGMGLAWNGREGQYDDASGRLAAFDPSVAERGPGALLVRRDALRRWLDDNRLDLFWIVFGEKRMLGGWGSGTPTWMEMNGAFRLEADGPAGEMRQAVCSTPATSRARGQPAARENR